MARHPKAERDRVASLPTPSHNGAFAEDAPKSVKGALSLSDKSPSSCRDYLLTLGLSEDESERASHPLSAWLLSDAPASLYHRGEPTLCCRGEDMEPLLRELDACPTEEEASIVCSIALTALRYPHDSGWIRYDRKAILSLSGVKEGNKWADKEMPTILRRHRVSLRVVGSENPTPCLCADWLPKEGEVPLGTYEKGGGREAAKRLRKE